jgi:hypothetical protein
MKSPLFYALVLLAAGLAPAQTFVVDVQNGPGTNFTSITAAIGAVPNGSTLLVRPGAYAPFDINSKGLTILAEPGTSVSGTCVVRNTQAVQHVTLSGIDVAAVTPGIGAALHVHDCAGPILLARMTTPVTVAPEPTIATFYYLPRGLIAQRCQQLAVRDCTITAISLLDSESLIEACTLRGNDQAATPVLPAPANEGLLIGDGTTDVVASDVTGGDGLAGGNAAAGN